MLWQHRQILTVVTGFPVLANSCTNQTNNFSAAYWHLPKLKGDTQRDAKPPGSIEVGRDASLIGPGCRPMNNHLKCPRCGMLFITNRKKSAKLTGVDGSGDARQKLPAIRLAVRLISNTAKRPRPALTRAGRAPEGLSTEYSHCRQLTKPTGFSCARTVW
jgi:hypothetical protein